MNATDQIAAEVTSRPHRVSIVVPCFNQGEYLEACLDSIAAQTVAAWEAIIVDDASATDQVRQVVENFNDPRVRALRHDENRGAGAARNTGFREATGEFVLPLDADDLLEPTYLETTVAVLSQTTDIDCVFTDLRLFGSTSKLSTNDGTHDLREILRRQWIPGAGTLMRRTVWERVGGYWEDRRIVGNEDWEFWIAALASGATARHIPEPLYLYRQHEGSTSGVLRTYEEFLHRELIYERHRDLFDRYSAGGEFRAVGYFNSARFAAKRHEWKRAARLTWKGMRLPHGVRPYLRAVVAFAVSRTRRRLTALKLPVKDERGEH